jgi:hypothetical protein
MRLHLPTDLDDAQLSLAVVQHSALVYTHSVDSVPSSRTNYWLWVVVQDFVVVILVVVEVLAVGAVSTELVSSSLHCLYG